jgi:hypothetical protein
MGGGQTKTPSHFAEIRKQLIWGSKLIMFKNKSLMFDNWITSDLIYINDILNENGEIRQNLILNTRLIEYWNLCLQKQYLMIGVIHYRLNIKLYQKCGKFSKK